MKRHIQIGEGFTLLEILIAVTILAVIVIIATPWYLGYIDKSAASEAYHMARPAQLSIEEFYQYYHRFPNSNAEAGLKVPESYTGKYVTAVTIHNDGQIIVELRLPSTAESKQLIFYPEE